ncbi:bifunctional cobalt-precorrin-7 (C(5))-methyltransferase/cobalt-precorrin-6B (C(15))-methyltransferase [Carnimonas nigrificans]|uniref:bifunctional cobalt-precorrin-7 (C(5))-methyltransferase/cobalt-precorrin-6B (C(15))-methyltransferase n=1 Tax=Carnimonas nigrificans TaxID=64323 RepID=UPI0004AD4434|nr:bifunctional cobalt-precorrin-7 (C(5))-methyltransferase/cobalt-precorrin-6B (C(15))-methyltransferase [Carnimonas nigrificans]
MLKDNSATDTTASARSAWLTIIGINEDGLEGLRPTARHALSAARVVFGGKRHLSLAAPLIQGDRETWQSPIERSIQHIRQLAGQPIVVLASGDPFLYGIGSSLARVIPAAEMNVFPAPSAFSLGCAKLGWAQQDTALVSVCGRPLSQLDQALKHGARIMVLSAGSDSPRQIAQYLCQHGYQCSSMKVLEALGGADERARHYATLDDFDEINIHPLNIVALELSKMDEANTETAGSDSLAPGRPRAEFFHDGQISREEIRAIVQARLAPQQGDCLWDIGAGSGAVALEWLLLDKSLRAVAVECHSERCLRIEANARRFGVADRLEVVEGNVPAAINAMTSLPNAIFVGGGASAEVINAAAARLAPAGRLVVNSVTLESEALIMEYYRDQGGSLSRFSIEHCAPLGALTGWQPARSIMQWCWRKPDGHTELPA